MNPTFSSIFKTSISNLLAALLVLTAVSISSSPSNNSQAQTSTNWYEGGTLGTGNGLDWQEATHANKLATCADLLAALWQRKKLSREITRTLRTIDDFKPWAEKLVSELNDAFEPEPDPEDNRNLFQNQGVADIAIMVMVVEGWLAL